MMILYQGQLQIKFVLWAELRLHGGKIMAARPQWEVSQQIFPSGLGPRSITAAPAAYTPRLFLSYTLSAVSKSTCQSLGTHGLAYT